MTRALRIDSPKAEPLCVDMSLTSASDVEQLRDSHVPAVYVLEAVKMRKLLSFKSAIVDLGEKHSSIPLQKYLLGNSGIPILEARYLHAGRMVSAARKLVGQAEAVGDKNVYVLGISPELFERLWSLAKDNERQELDSSPSSPASSDLAGTVEEDVFALLNNDIVGVSPQIQELRNQIHKVASRHEKVLVEGESGTGKELVAWFIHECSNRRAEPYIRVNIGALPKERIEAELFGWVKGAFPGAYYDKKGMWVLAGRGTLLLDEIGDFDVDLQVKILRVLQENEVWPIGAEKPTKVYARIVACTNRDLAAKVTDRSFTEALYWRLVPLTLHTPALRERPEDIDPIARYLWRQITGSDVSRLADSLIEQLLRMPWPGNVRELDAVLRRLYVFFESDQPKPNDLATILKLHTSISPPVQTGNLQKKPADLRTDCLNHLHRVSQAARAIKVAFRPISETRKKWGIADFTGDLQQTPEELVELGVTQGEEELDLLCAQPLLFYDPLVFQAVYNLRGKLLYLLGLLRRNGRGSKAFYTKELKPQMTLVTELLFRTMRELLDAT